MALETPVWLANMESILETLNEGVLIVDWEGIIIFANHVAEEMIGVPSDELFGREGLDFYCGADRDFLALQRDVSKERGSHRYEFFVPHTNGKNTPVMVAARQFHAPDGTALAIITLTDISEVKTKEKQLRRANEQLRQRQAEIDSELAMAERVQQSLVPQSLVWGGMTVESHYQPARKIGGDFGMVAPGDSEHLDVLVCDVSGHGIGSALMANRIYTETLRLLERRLSLEQVFQRINAMVVEQIGILGFFFTMAAARIGRDGHMHYIGAGHPPALIVSPDGGVRRLEPRWGLLGVARDAEQEAGEERLHLAPGERLLLYTDGLTEVFDAQQRMLDYDGLSEIAGRHAHRPLSEMRQNILADVESWRHGPVTDDTSLVLVEISPS